MADNTVLDAGAGGDTIATDDVAGVKYQVVKLAVGADGAADLVSSSAPVPVIAVANSGVDIGDVTVNNATLAVTQSGTWDVGTVTTVTAVTDITNPITVNSHAVTNAGTFAVQAAQSGTWNVGTVTAVTTVSTVTAVTDVTNAVKVVGPAAHDAAVSGAPVRLGAYAKAAAPTDVSADGDTVNVWADLAGRLAVWDGGLNLSIDDGGNTITVDGTVAVTGVSTAAKQDTIIGHLDGVEALLTTIDADTSNLSVVGGGTEAAAIRVTLASDSTGVLSVDDNGGALTVDGTVTANLAAGTNNIGDVDILSIAAGDNNIGNVDVASLPATPAGTNLIGRVSASLETGTIYQGTTARTPTFVAIDAATSGDNTLVAAAGASNKIRVHALFLVAAGTVNVRFESGAGGTALSGQMNLIANTGFVLPFNPVGWFETAADTLLNLELSGAVSVDGSLVYTVVT